jgi:sialidase-1
VAEGTEQLVAKGAKDLVLSGGATVVNEGFDTCLRSGSPHQSPVAAIKQPMAAGSTVQSLSVAFEYTAGWSGAIASNFSVVIGETVLYASGALGNYNYRKDAPGNYSPAILAQATGLSIALPKTHVSQIELRFQNNDRNLQLRLPLVFNLTCDGPCVAVPPPPPAPPWTPTALFVDGNRDQDNKSWACVRGVALLRSPDRTLMAFSGGKSDCADGSVGNAILLRRSVDNGTSWSPVQSVAAFNETGGYVAPIADRKRGQVLVLYNVRFVETWLTRSTDNGLTWSQPVNMTAATGVVALGPPGGVQLRSGRLVLAVHGANGTAALYSDDGQAWTLGAPVPFDVGVVSGGESQLVDDKRTAASLSMIIRVSSHDVLLNHAIAQSDDGGTTWRNASLLVNVTGPTCQGSIARLADGSIVVAAPHYPRWRYPADRKNMSLFVYAPNDTKKLHPKVAEVWRGPSAYSGMDTEGEFVMFEGGATYRYASVMIVKTNLTRS